VAEIVRSVASAQLTPTELRLLRTLFDTAWPNGGFSDDDMAHALGGRHWLIEAAGRIVSHASVVERILEVDGRPLRTGSLEAVATEPAHQRQGLGSRVVTAATGHIRARFELGGLSTGSPGFYERLGWIRWRGPTFVRTADALLRTADEDDGIMVLATPASPPLDPAAPISCEWRPGDVW
jgi:aminoglycoside 2'-N-acetyltransferase I